MRKLLISLVVLGALLMSATTVLAANLFDVSLDTNGGANRFWVTPDCTYRVSGQAVGGQPSFDNIGDWLVEAGRVFGGELVSTGNFNGNGAPNNISVNSNARVNIGGANTGGNYRWDFATVEAGQNFVDFVKMVRSDDSNLFKTNCGLPLPTDFDVSLDTNGGANRFYIENNQFKIWGQSVSGIFATTDVIEWVQEAARLYDCDTVRNGNFNYNATPNIRRAQDNGRAVLGGRGVGGSFVWQCDNQPEAQNFVDFLNLIAREGLFELDLTN